MKLKGLNDAKYIAMAVYITNFVSAVTFVSFYSLKRFQNLYAALFSLSILCGTTAILALVFIPKVQTPVWLGVDIFRKDSFVFASQSQQIISLSLI